MESSQIARIVESGISPLPTAHRKCHGQYSPESDHITFTLQDEALWQKFNQVVNEMIVTKSGR